MSSLSTFSSGINGFTVFLHNQSSPFYDVLSIYTVCLAGYSIPLENQAFSDLVPNMTPRALAPRMEACRIAFVGYHFGRHSTAQKHEVPILSLSLSFTVFGLYIDLVLFNLLSALPLHRKRSKTEGNLWKQKQQYHGFWRHNIKSFFNPQHVVPATGRERQKRWVWLLLRDVTAKQLSQSRQKHTTFLVRWLTAVLPPAVAVPAFSMSFWQRSWF